MKITLRITLDRLEGWEQNPHRVTEELGEQLLLGRTIWVHDPHSLADDRTSYDVVNVDVLDVED
jgi:hypothetical protein